MTRDSCRIGNVPVVVAALLSWAVLGLAPASLHAQGASEPDSTLEGSSQGAPPPSGGGLADIGRAASQGTMPDSSLAAVQEMFAAGDEGFDWFESFKPTFTAEVQANVQNIVYRGGFSAGARVLDGGDTQASFSLESKTYRQQDRDFLGRNLGASFARPLRRWAALNIDFGNRYTRDVTIFSQGTESVIESDASKATVRLEGAGKSTYGFGHAWSLRGNIDDTKASSRGTNNDRTLASGGTSLRWNYQSLPLQVVGRFGYDQAKGDRALRGQTAPATTTQDTVGTTVTANGGRWFNLTASADRMSFVEERLDFRRNSSGVIDTLNIPPQDVVGQEREQQTVDGVSVSANTRPLSRMGLQSTVSHRLQSTRYRFSAQGLEERSSDHLDVGGSFRYAEAGSLSAAYEYNDQWDDRRVRGSTTFRGRESRVGKAVRFGIAQRLFTSSDLQVDYSQRLDQNIFEQVGNQNDRDQLIDRVDGRLVSRAISDLQMNVGATFSLTRTVNIAADRVGNNKDESLYEVRGGYRWLPADRFSFEQNYRLQIVFIDFYTSNDRDQFNKQGQFSSEAKYTFRRGGTVRMRYAVDFRRNGTRAPDQEGDQVAYVTDLRRFDHRVTASIVIPLRTLEVAVDSERGFLRDENPSTGVLRKEDRGEIRMRVTGSYGLFRGKATLRVDVQKILAYGPRVRPENENYWVANSGLTVTF